MQNTQNDFNSKRWMSALALAVVALSATLLSGCDEIAEGEPCSDRGEIGCDGRQVLQCERRGDENEWVEIARCNSSQTCRTVGSSYECAN